MQDDDTLNTLNTLRYLAMPLSPGRHRINWTEWNHCKLSESSVTGTPRSATRSNSEGVHGRPRPEGEKEMTDPDYVAYESPADTLRQFNNGLKKREIKGEFTPRSLLIDLHRKLCKEAQDILEKKNHDYSKDEDPFSNFRTCESRGICSAEEGILVRVDDKLSRLSQLFKKGAAKVTTESERDTILDIINYAVLLYALREDRNIKSIA